MKGQKGGREESVDKTKGTHLQKEVRPDNLPSLKLYYVAVYTINTLRNITLVQQIYSADIIIRAMLSVTDWLVFHSACTFTSFMADSYRLIFYRFLLVMVLFLQKQNYLVFRSHQYSLVTTVERVRWVFTC